MSWIRPYAAAHRVMFHRSKFKYHHIIHPSSDPYQVGGGWSLSLRLIFIAELQING